MPMEIAAVTSLNTKLSIVNETKPITTIAAILVAPVRLFTQAMRLPKLVLAASTPCPTATNSGSARLFGS